MTGGRSEGYLSKDCEGTGEKTRSDDEECGTGPPHLLPCEEQVEGKDLLLMARDTSPEEETAVVKVKVDRGLVREEVSFAKLVADLARKQKCTVSSLKMMRGSVMETMTKDSHISITSSMFLRIYMPSLKTDAATKHCPLRVYPHWEDEDSLVVQLPNNEGRGKRFTRSGRLKRNVLVDVYF